MWCHPMLKLLSALRLVKVPFSTYSKTLWCANCQKEFRVRIGKGCRVAPDASGLAVMHVLKDSPYDPFNQKNFKGMIQCPTCKCSSCIQPYVKEVLDGQAKRTTEND